MVTRCCHSTYSHLRCYILSHDPSSRRLLCGHCQRMTLEATFPAMRDDLRGCLVFTLTGVSIRRSASLAPIWRTIQGTNPVAPVLNRLSYSLEPAHLEGSCFVSSTKSSESDSLTFLHGDHDLYDRVSKAPSMAPAPDGPLSLGRPAVSRGQVIRHLPPSLGDPCSVLLYTLSFCIRLTAKLLVFFTHRD
jgi:hypothetical protein